MFLRNYQPFISKVFFLAAFFIITISSFGRPIIASFAPVSGVPGSVVTITGSGFSATAANNVVYFGGVRALVSAATANQLMVTVPVSATYNRIKVTTAGLTAASPQYFVPTFTGTADREFRYNSFVDKGKIQTDPPINSENMTVGDIDGDGKLDVAVIDQVNRILLIYRNTGTIGNPAFAPKIIYNIYYNATYVALDDLNGDGKLDVIVTTRDAFTGFISVFQNVSTNGNVSLLSALDYPIPEYQSGIGVADFDSDGKPELIVTGNVDDITIAPTISILKNTSSPGQISFLPRTDFLDDNPHCANGIALNDFDKDGKPDLVLSYYWESKVEVYKNTTTGGTFSFDSVYSVPAEGCQTLNMADVDNDCNNDVVLCYFEGNKFSALLNKSFGASISLANPVDITISTELQFRDIGIGDLNGDSKPDFAIAEDGGFGGFSNIYVYRNLSTPQSVSIPDGRLYNASGGKGNLLADMDGDGLSDILVIGRNNGIDNGISVFLNNAFSPYITSFTPQKAFAGDQITIKGGNLTGATAVGFGGVAAASFVVVNDSLITATLAISATGKVSVTTPKGTFELIGFIYDRNSPLITNFTPESGLPGSTITINGKYFGSTIASNFVFFGAVKATITAASSTQLQVTVPIGTTYQPITVSSGNLTGIAAKPFNVLFGNGEPSFVAGNFAPATQFTASDLTNERTAAADIDGDGKVDLVTLKIISPTSGGISIMRNISTKISEIKFATPVTIVTGIQPAAICIRDMDGDGKLDILVGDKSTYAGVFKNNSSPGSISFGPKYVLFGGNEDIAVADFDDDGKPEVVTTSAGGQVFIGKNTSIGGTLSFILYKEINLDNTTGKVIVGDFNGDKKIDMAILNQTYNSSISIFANRSINGDIVLNSEQGISLGNSSPQSLTTADIDGDGKLDLAVCYRYGDQFTTLRNTSVNGSFSFDDKQDHSTAGISGTGELGQCIASDLNGDGKPDMVVATNSWYLVFKNLSQPGSISLASYKPYFPGGLAGNILAADFDNDGKPDLARKLNIIQVIRNQLDNTQVASFSPQNGGTGTTITIKGNKFTGATSVKIGTMAAYSYTVISDTIITTIVGNGATGIITVTTPSSFSYLGDFTFTPAKTYSYSPLIEWEKSYGTSDIENANQIKTTIDGGYIIVGTSSNGQFQISNKLVKKISSKGDIEWDKTYGASDALRDGRVVIDNKDGTFLIAGYQSFPFSRSTVSLLKISSYGDSIWERIVQSPGNYGEYVFRDLVATNDGGYIMTGYIMTAATISDSIQVIKVNSNGYKEWSKYYGQPSSYSSGIIQTTDDGYLITGYKTLTVANNNESEDYWLLKIDDNGNVQWEKTIGGTGNDRANITRQTKDGGYIVAGKAESKDGDMTGNTLSSPVIVFKLNAIGNIQWRSILSYTGGNIYDVKQTSDSGYILCGHTFNFNEYNVALDAQVWLVKLDKFGTMEWQKIMGSSYSDHGTSVEQTADGGYIVAGDNRFNDQDVTKNYGEDDFWVVKLGTSGIVSLCPSLASTKLASFLHGGSYQWQVNTGSSFVNVAGANYAGAITDTLSLNSIPSSWSGYKYRCLVDGAYTATYTLKIENRWLGTVSNEWNNPANWSCGNLPDGKTDVVIRTGNVIVSSNASCKSLTVINGAVTVKPGIVFTITH